MLDLYQSLGRCSKFYRCLCSNYACLQALVNNAFVKQRQQKLFVQGYNLEIHDVIKYMQKHRATVIISRTSQFICVT